jgi:hypothetical protein
MLDCIVPKGHGALREGGFFFPLATYGHGKSLDCWGCISQKRVLRRRMLNVMRRVIRPYSLGRTCIVTYKPTKQNKKTVR